jgi:hypothetical protein
MPCNATFIRATRFTEMIRGSIWAGRSKISQKPFCVNAGRGTAMFGIQIHLAERHLLPCAERLRMQSHPGLELGIGGWI